MESDAGETAGESLEPTSAAELVAQSVAGLPPEPRVRVELDGDGARTLTVPRRAVAQAISSVVKNAQDASSAGAEVLVRAGWQGDVLILLEGFEDACCGGVPPAPVGPCFE